jgi:hypothetical protein
LLYIIQVQGWNKKMPVLSPHLNPLPEGEEMFFLLSLRGRRPHLPQGDDYRDAGDRAASGTAAEGIENQLLSRRGEEITPLPPGDDYRDVGGRVTPGAVTEGLG